MTISDSEKVCTTPNSDVRIGAYTPDVKSGFCTNGKNQIILVDLPNSSG